MIKGRSPTTKMMKVMHINGNYVYSALHQTMAEQLERMGIENTVFAPVYDKNAGTVKLNDYAKAVKCFEKWDRLFFNLKQKKIFAAAENNFDVKNCDLLHAYTLFTDGYCAMNLAKKHDKPYVVAVRNTDVNTFFKYMPHLRRKGVEVLKNAAAVFFLSKAYEKTVVEKYVPEKYKAEILAKSRIIPNGIDPFWLQKEPAPKAAPRSGEIKLVYAGGIDKNKNVTKTQQAMAVLRQRGIKARLTVVGQVKDQAEYKRVAADGHTTVLGAKPKEELIDIYKNGHIFIMPSHKETFGLVYAEAMSCGLPVLYTKGQGFDCQFEQGEAGYAISDRDEFDIADKIMLCVENYGEISARCPRLAQKFNWEKIADEYCKIYEQAVLNHKERP